MQLCRVGCLFQRSLAGSDTLFRYVGSLTVAGYCVRQIERRTPKVPGSLSVMRMAFILLFSLIKGPLQICEAIRFGALSN